MNSNIKVHTFYTNNVPEHLRKLFMEEFRKWDNSVTLECFYDITVCYTMLEYARQKYS